VSDGLLITGQNPASAKDVGKAVVKALQAEAARPVAR
jgi:putative intracellular protease/amidase